MGRKKLPEIELFHKSYLFSVDVKYQGDLDSENISEGLRSEFRNNKITLSQNACVEIQKEYKKWIIEEENKTRYSLIREGNTLNIYKQLYKDIELLKSLGNIAGYHPVEATRKRAKILQQYILLDEDISKVARIYNTSEAFVILSINRFNLYYPNTFEKVNSHEDEENVLNLLPDEKFIDLFLEAKFQELITYLHNKYFFYVYGKIGEYTKEEPERTDITHDVFIKFYKFLPNFKLDTGSIAYLNMIIKSVISDYFRKQEKQINFYPLPGEIESKKQNLFQHLILEEWLEKAFYILSPQEHKIIFLKFYDGLSYKEIAEKIGKSEDACKQQVHRIIKKLRNELEDQT